jgi:hypothetical protein
MIHRRWSHTVVIVLLLLIVAACGPATSSPPVSSAGGPLVEDALARDAESYASEYNVDLEEALRRLQLQDLIGELNAELAEQERDTFAGLWIEHTPEFRVWVRFTRDGEDTIRPYIADGPLAGIVEVRGASASLAQLEAAQAALSSVLSDLEVDVSHGLNVAENRVELFVADRARFERLLLEAGIQLPDHVELMAVGGYRAGEIDVCATPGVPGVAFPRQGPVEGLRVVMQAEMVGQLVLVDGCLRLESIYGDTSYLPVWPPEFALRSEDEEIQVLDGTGQVVARVGEEIFMGGGEGSASVMAKCVRQQLPVTCTGPYWIVGEGVRPNLRRDSDLFSMEIISTDARSFFLLRKKAVLDDWAERDAPLSGELVLWDYNRCLRVVSDGGLGDYLPLWPADYAARVTGDGVEILDGSGWVFARVGQQVRLDGGDIPVVWNLEPYQSLLNELPRDCHGPYWIVSD